MGAEGIALAYSRQASAQGFESAVGSVPTTLGELTPSILGVMARHGIVASYQMPDGRFWRGKVGQIGYEEWDNEYRTLPAFDTLPPSTPIALSFGREGVRWTPARLGVVHNDI